MRVPILLLIEHLSDGGSERHLHDVANLIDLGRFEPHVIYFEGGIMSERLAANAGVRLLRLPPMKKTASLAFARTLLLLRNYARKNRIRVMVTFHFLSDLLGAATALTLPGLILISSRRDMGITRTRRQRQLMRLLGFRFDRYIAVSQAVKVATARQEGVPESKIRVIYNGTDFDDLLQKKWDRGAERRALGIGADEIVIGCVANFNPFKGHQTLIEAFDRLCERLPGSQLRLLLAGDGPLREVIEKEIVGRGLSTRVSLVGHSPDPTKEFLIADIVVSPSATEGFSNTIIEAMAFGKPVVATAVGGTPEAVEDGVNGLLVPPGDPNRLAEALATLITERDLAGKLGARASHDVRGRFGCGQMIQAIEQLIADAIGV